MKFYNSGYTSHQFITSQLRGIAKQTAIALPKVMEELGADAVVVMGRSGISMAFATLMLIDFPLIVVRKRGENSHGDIVEGPTGINVRSYIILDDFVSSGSTVAKIMGEMGQFDRYVPDADRAKCAGILYYKGQVPFTTTGIMYEGKKIDLPYLSINAYQ